MYKKIYLEITNRCNLACDFCPHNKRELKSLSMDDFKTILDKLENHTKYLYFHVLGEPLLHENINEFIDYASNRFKINITTNGYLIKKIKNNRNIRQLNISLQSYDKRYNKTLEEYLNDIFEVVDELKKETYISLRLWVLNNNTKDILKHINERYNVNIDYTAKLDNIKLDSRVFLSFHEEFNWPSINAKEEYKTGTCYALKDHIGILVDGTIIPCCLDSEGSINLGNIYKDTIYEVKKSERYINMLEGFKQNKKCEKLCQTCNFINKKN